MRGFDNKALILFPRLDSYSSKSELYKRQFRVAYGNLVKYLSDVHIEPHCFYTDDVARKVALDGVKWVSPMTMAERFFASNNCDGMQGAMAPMITYDELYKIAEKNKPSDLSASTLQRFATIETHVKYVTTKIIEGYSIVIYFMLGKKGQYKLDLKEGESKIRMIVDTNTFSPTCYLGGNEEDCCDLLGVPYGNRSLDNWGLI